MGRKKKLQKQLQMEVDVEAEDYDYEAREPCYVILEAAPRRQRQQSRWRWMACVALWMILGVVAGGCVYVLWPSEPRMELVRMKLEGIRWHTQIHPISILLDVDLGVTAKVTNKNYVGVYYNHVMVNISYRGENIGSVRSESGYIGPRATAYVEADVNLTDIDLADVLYFLEDIAKGSIPFTSLTYFDGYIRILGFSVPLKATVNCEVLVDTQDHSVSNQDCSIRSIG
eukprot:TRINITY_DN8087_c0_g1_i1.p1 TRINITY_DN8087_c0_g1~~TRINITY_DN8087_c0_g1_i1.p1  ORF type:complete len:228 (-),score=6.75 TRINITY_DN8087_c0_g1_i1:345-1028(-)